MPRDSSCPTAFVEAPWSGRPALQPGTPGSAKPTSSAMTPSTSRAYPRVLSSGWSLPPWLNNPPVRSWLIALRAEARGQLVPGAGEGESSSAPRPQHSVYSFLRRQAGRGNRGHGERGGCWEWWFSARTGVFRYLARFPRQIDTEVPWIRYNARLRWESMWEGRQREREGNKVMGHN